MFATLVSSYARERLLSVANKVMMKERGSLSSDGHTFDLFLIPQRRYNVQQHVKKIEKYSNALSLYYEGQCDAILR